MLSDVKRDLTRKYRDLKIWVEKLDNSPSFAIERGLYFVYVYGVFEWLVTTVIQRTIEELNEYEGSIDEYIYDVYPLIFSNEFDSIQGSGNKTKWISRAAISKRLKENDTISISTSIIPTDGRNIQVKQLESIALIFGKNGDILPSDRMKGYIVGTVENRNHIAHGDETPGEVGSRTTKDDILKNYENMQELSEFFVEQYDQYIKNKEFLRNKVTINKAGLNLYEDGRVSDRTERRNDVKKVYCYSKCTTCEKALKWLDDNKIEYEQIDIKEDHPDEKTLRLLHKKSGLPLKKFFNTSGQLYREMELSKKLPDMSEDEMFKLLASDGMLVKRPLLITEDTVLTGFKEEDWRKAL